MGDELGWSVHQFLISNAHEKPFRGTQAKQNEGRGEMEVAKDRSETLLHLIAPGCKLKWVAAYTSGKVG